MSVDLVAALEQELARSLARAAAVQACLDALHLGAPSGRVPRPGHARGRTPDRRRRSVPRPRTTGRAKTTQTDATVLAAVKAGHATTKAIVAETNLPVYNVRCALKRLVEAKSLTRSGATSNLHYALK